MERLILQDSGRGMATDSVDSSIDIMECIVKMKKNLDREAGAVSGQSLSDESQTLNSLI
jgi:hypothetical protein